VYEQDWLFTEYLGTSRTLQSATLAHDWLMQMGAGAEKSKRVIQCVVLNYARCAATWPTQLCVCVCVGVWVVVNGWVGGGIVAVVGCGGWWWWW